MICYHKMPGNRKTRELCVCGGHSAGTNRKKPVKCASNDDDDGGDAFLRGVLIREKRDRVSLCGVVVNSLSAGDPRRRERERERQRVVNNVQQQRTCLSRSAVTVTTTALVCVHVLR